MLQANKPDPVEEIRNPLLTDSFRAFCANVRMSTMTEPSWRDDPLYYSYKDQKNGLVNKS